MARRRLDLAASLIAAADLYFLDEPTTGLDPASRTQVHQIIRSLAASGATVLLTTQYLEEADQLASRIAVIDHGTVAAEGTPGELKAAAGTGTLRIRLADPAHRPRAMQLLTPLLGQPPLAGADPVMLTAAIPAGRSAQAPSEQAAEALAALTAPAAFGWRALLKIKHVPEQLFDVIAIPVVFTLMFSWAHSRISRVQSSVLG